jgi:hypothetical protein
MYITGTIRCSLGQPKIPRNPLSEPQARSEDHSDQQFCTSYSFFQNSGSLPNYHRSEILEWQPPPVFPVSAGSARSWPGAYRRTAYLTRRSLAIDLVGGLTAYRDLILVCPPYVLADNFSSGARRSSFYGRQYRTAPPEDDGKFFRTYHCL